MSYTHDVQLVILHSTMTIAWLNTRHYKTKSRMSVVKFYWPLMVAFITDYIHLCSVCIAAILTTNLCHRAVSHRSCIMQWGACLH